MKRHTQKLTRILGVFASLSLAATPIAASAVTNTKTAEFRVNVTEILTVSLTLPDEWASGSTGDLLRNGVKLNVASNNGNGFNATMSTKTASTSLANKNSAATIPTLTADTTRANFPTNSWGYSVNDTAAGDDTSTYKALVGAGNTPISLIASDTAASAEQNIYFAAKADASKDSGTYTNTVVFNVVSGVIDEDNPIVPNTPATQEDTTPENNPAYDSVANRTVYSSTTHNTADNTTTNTTEVSRGDTRSSYTRPQGVKSSSEANIGEGTPLATGLAVTAGIAAALGVVFFVVAKRKERDNEEE